MTQSVNPPVMYLPEKHVHPLVISGPVLLLDGYFIDTPALWDDFEWIIAASTILEEQAL